MSETRPNPIHTRGTTMTTSTRASQHHTNLHGVEVWTTGNLDLLDQIHSAISVTGSRAATAYGESVAHDYAAALTTHGHTLVTGGGFGIEAAAIRGTLASHGAPVVVAGGGLNTTHPAAHRDLFETVLEAGGLLLSLAQPGAVPTRAGMRRRAVWMGATTAATLVVEASVRGAAIHTATAATRGQRPVGAVPGPVTSATSCGTHDLIRDGAHIVYDERSLRAFTEHATIRS